MPTQDVIGKINTLLVTIQTQQKCFTISNETITKELELSKNKGDVKRATTFSVEIEKQKLNLIVLGKIEKLLTEYLDSGDLKKLFEGHKSFQREHNQYGAQWNVLGFLSRLFMSDPMEDIYSCYKAFIIEETRELLDKEQLKQERDKAEFDKYLQTPEGKSMAGTMAFLVGTQTKETTEDFKALFSKKI